MDSVKERIEVRDGREFTVTVLPKDRRLGPKATRDRAFWNALTYEQKAAAIRKRKAAAAKKRRRKKRRGAA